MPSFVIELYTDSPDEYIERTVSFSDGLYFQYATSEEKLEKDITCPTAKEAVDTRTVVDILQTLAKLDGPVATHPVLGDVSQLYALLTDIVTEMPEERPGKRKSKKEPLCVRLYPDWLCHPAELTEEEELPATQELEEQVVSPPAPPHFSPSPAPPSPLALPSPALKRKAAQVVLPPPDLAKKVKNAPPDAVTREGPPPAPGRVMVSSKKKQVQGSLSLELRSDHRGFPDNVFSEHARPFRGYCSFRAYWKSCERYEQVQAAEVVDFWKTKATRDTRFFPGSHLLTVTHYAGSDGNNHASAQAARRKILIPAYVEYLLEAREAVDSRLEYWRSVRARGVDITIMHEDGPRGLSGGATVVEALKREIEQQIAKNSTRFEFSHGFIVAMLIQGIDESKFVNGRGMYNQN